ncbi:MAG: mechanosensitive ion channel family protein [Bacteroidetes bacterium]|nr:mechanosensitive ion channel family protein [Bacteroidota bacterium]MDA0904153.1 mechanosensitive ion channel family protein [Bacteroidota bacterium]MDA1242677.1 mechanosensitive ion channel family protein [Bacteroidota bacterium]
MEILNDTSFLGNPLLEWAQALGYFLGGVLLARLAFILFKRVFQRLAAKTQTQWDDVLVDQVEEPVALGIVILGFWLGYEHLHFGAGVDDFMEHVFQILIAIDITWLVARLLDSVVSNIILHLDQRTDSATVAQFAPILQKTLRALVWILGIISGLTNAGYDVGALLAGVGIGGLAMAMAAKDFVANIFGGITVFVDKPFTVGERIKVNGIDGTVQEIGIRSTRIKTLENRLVTIPNHQFTDQVVENVTAEPSRKMKIVLGLTYDTTPEQIQQALDLLTEIVEESGRTEDEYTVWFSGFGDFSLNVSVIYFIRKGEHWAHVPSDIHMKILQRFNAAGLEFAFPTQTLHHVGAPTA